MIYGKLLLAAAAFWLPGQAFADGDDPFECMLAQSLPPGEQSTAYNWCFVHAAELCFRSSAQDVCLNRLPQRRTEIIRQYLGLFPETTDGLGIGSLSSRRYQRDMELLRSEAWIEDIHMDDEMCFSLQTRQAFCHALHRNTVINTMLHWADRLGISLSVHDL